MVLPLAAVLTAGITGCGASEGASQDRHTQQVQPLGYYSNENHENNGNGNVQILDNDNDGPLTEIMDHSFGEEARDLENDRRQMLQNKDENGNPPNPSKPLADYDRNFFQHDNRYSHGDANYHGHLDDNTSKPRSSYYNAYEGELAEKLNDVAARVPNVEDVRAVAYGSNVLIAVDLEDESKMRETKAAIRRAAQPYLGGRTITVVHDEGTFSRVRNIDNDIRDGGPREHINLDLRNLFRSSR